MAVTVNLVLYPQVQSGADVAAVKKKLQTTLIVDAATLDSWYSTVHPTAILTNVEETIAAKYLSAIQECGAELTFNPATEIRLIGGLSKRPIQIQRFRLFVLSVNTKNKLGRQAGWENARNAAWSLQNGEQKYGKRLGKKKIVAA